MLFNSVAFLIFFPSVMFLYFLVPVKIKNFVLLVASYIFYMGWNPKYALLLLFCTVLTFSVSLIIERIKKNSSDVKKIKSMVALSVFLILGILFFFKYLNFTNRLLNSLFSLLNIKFSFKKYDIVLPVGISFFSFQAIGYLIDVYRGEIYAERNFFKYALFVSFFPQLVAGPIERSKNLLKQLDKTYRFSFANLKSGLYTMLYGYFLKVVVADRASILVDYVYANSGATGIQILFATFIFAFQIYCDFCGYSTIAIGASKIIGIELVQNFNTPYFSTSVKDFWRRWHISLSSWFRDYLYFPLGGGRRGRLRKNLNVLAVMLVSGIWHGAGVNYIFWGLLNGLFQIFDDLTGEFRKRFNAFIQIILTFISVCFTWLFFRADSMGHSMLLLGRIFRQFDPISLVKDIKGGFGMGGVQIGFLLFTIIMLLTVDWFRFKKISIKNIMLSKNWLVQSFSIAATVLFILVFGVWGADYNPAVFIYFQF